MFLRVLYFLMLFLFCTSCDKFSFSKSKTTSSLDTIVDFSTVDTFPSFKVCDSLINKEIKADCFRNTIHKKIGEELQKHIFTIRDSIDDMVTVHLIINSKGEVLLDEINSSTIIKE
jgi:hypothetical protein